MAAMDQAQEFRDAYARRQTVDERSGSIGGRVLDRRRWAPVAKELSEVSDWESAKAIATQWIVIAAAIAAAVYAAHPLAYVLAIVVIATRQHALGILMHDASHYRLFTNRKWNDIITNWFVAFPMGSTADLYRRWHFPHHQFVNTDRDPEVMGERADPELWQFPKPRSRVLQIALKDIAGLHIVRMMKVMEVWSAVPRLFLKDDDPAALDRSEKHQFIAYNALVVVALTALGGWVHLLLFWFVPILTVFNIIFRYRSFAEHKVVPNANELSTSRTVLPTTFEKFLLAPLNVNYHLEHHLFPGVPFYNLAKLHRRLMEDPLYAEQACITKGYLDPKAGVLAEITDMDQVRRLAFEPAH